MSLVFLHFMQKFKMAFKNGGERIFGKKWQITAYTVGVNNFVEIALSQCVFAFYTEIQYGRQKWQENDFWEMWKMT